MCSAACCAPCLSLCSPCKNLVAGQASAAAVGGVLLLVVVDPLQQLLPDIRGSTIRGSLQKEE